MRGHAKTIDINAFKLDLKLIENVEKNASGRSTQNKNETKYVEAYGIGIYVPENCKRKIEDGFVHYTYSGFITSIMEKVEYTNDTDEAFDSFIKGLKRGHAEYYIEIVEETEQEISGNRARKLVLYVYRESEDLAATYIVIDNDNSLHCVVIAVIKSEFNNYKNVIYEIENSIRLLD